MTTSSTSVAVSSDDLALATTADRLAHELGLPRCAPPCADFPYVLIYAATDHAQRLELRATHKDAPGAVYVDFVTGTLGFRTRHGGRGKESLARAVGLKSTIIPTVLDATAGLGRDAYILAALGCHVTLVERSPIIAALLRDGLARASAHPDTRIIAQHMHLRVGNAADLMGQLTESDRPDVVYLDPMYPHRNKSALVKKEMRLLRALVGEDQDASRTLEAALRVARKRVVVKRPRLAPSLPGPAPTHTVPGSTTRFDIYLRTPVADRG